LQGYITEACQLGLMGVGITAFNPNGVVTRAQFGTVLDRVLNGDANDGSDPYYADHLSALKDAGIMTNISNPNAPEVRGYVMLMMQRAAGATTPAVCETPENVLSCSLGLDTCPAECQTPDVIKSGTLNVTVSDYVTSVKSAPKNGTVVFNAIKFASSEEITVNTVTLQRMGLSTRSDIGSVWFEKDGVAVSSKGTVATDGKVSVVFNKGLVVKSSETLDLVVSLTAANAGAEVAFKFVDVTSTAVNLKLDATTTTYRTSDYTVGQIKFEALTGSAVSYKL
jgi:hypothetical protein